MMSGTSLDAIDVALVEFTRDRKQPATLQARLLHVGEEPWPAATRDALRAVLPPAPAEVGAWSRLHAAVGDAFGAAAARALAAHGGADLIATHGQTLFHEVEAGAVLSTLQIGDASRLAAATSTPVLHDLRSADVAAGGQGAPLVPLLDQLLLGGDAHPRTAVLNIGGISNLSLVGSGGDGRDADHRGADGGGDGAACAAGGTRIADEVVAGDLGPGNALLDAAIHAATGRPADIDAALARTGTVDAAALSTLLADPFYALPLPRSTGRERFDSRYVRRLLGQEALAALSLPDLLATLTELTAVTIAEAIAPRGVSRVVASGGGMRNPLLRQRLAALLAPVPLIDADDLGIPADGKEALLIALLGYLGAHGLPGTLARGDGTAHTGARTPVVLGSLTPPHALRALPGEPADTHAVERLEIVSAGGEGA
ncbi:anhydro-N-acetylmuramic acid kinase [Brachybacterium sp.]|uniref:anhydro-N-acetylmuramic acid kinase n=1 Tax=Brachybacterium sp. TaxID=1891286 RepID=UPI003F90A6CB